MHTFEIFKERKKSNIFQREENEPYDYIRKKKEKVSIEEMLKKSLEENS